MPKLIDLSGEKFGRLTVVSREGGPKGCKAPKWNVVCDCGKKKQVKGAYLRTGRTKSCGCLATENAIKQIRTQHGKGENCPAWKGGERKICGGYISIYTPNGVKLEHRVVMEKILGRKLFPKENVHHINGVKTDNRPENLELWVTQQPSGQRPQDLVAWAKIILNRYDN